MKRSKGFTILEVMIVLSVSGLIFVATMVAIGGRQQQVEYGQSTREFDSKIKDIMNDVTTGYFPSNPNLSCQINASGDLEVIPTATGQSIGTNNICLYIGKAIQFIPNIDGEQSSDKILVYSIVGRRFKDTNSNPATTLTEAQPKAADLPNEPTVVSSVEEYSLPYGLKVTRVFSPDVLPATNYGLVAFISSLSGQVSDSQQLNIGGVFNSQYDDTQSDSVVLLNKLTDSPPNTDGYFVKNPQTGIVVCLEDSDGKKASVEFGVRGSNDTKLDLDSFNTGCNS